MSSLSLQSFSSVFEILLAYYIGTASSEKFNGIFGVEENFIKLLNENYVFSTKTEELKKLHKRIAPSTADETDLDDSQIAKAAKLYSELVSLPAKKEKLERIKSEIFDGNLLWYCLRPFYVFAGLFSLWLLLLGGIIDNWERYDTIMYFNWIALGVLVFAIFRVMFRTNTKARHWGPVKSFGFSCFGFILLLMPNNWLYEFPHRIPYVWLTSRLYNVTFNDLQIFFAIFLVFSILLVHITYILIFAFRVAKLSAKMKKLYAEYYVVDSSRINIQMGDIGDGIKPLRGPK